MNLSPNTSPPLCRHVATHARCSPSLPPPPAAEQKGTDGEAICASLAGAAQALAARLGVEPGVLLFAAAAAAVALARLLAPRPPAVRLVDFAVYRPPASWRLSRKGFAKMSEGAGQFTPEDIEFQDKGERLPRSKRKRRRGVWAGRLLVSSGGSSVLRAAM